MTKCIICKKKIRKDKNKNVDKKTCTISKNAQFVKLTKKLPNENKSMICKKNA